jgi:hypothetical protein
VAMAAAGSASNTATTAIRASFRITLTCRRIPRIYQIIR